MRMYPRHAIDNENTSTPKRRRLGLSRNCVISQETKVLIENCSPVSQKPPAFEIGVAERCESPHLPCNQVEYLCDSATNSSCDILCSPEVLGTSVLKDMQSWESLVCTHDLTRKLEKRNEMDDISDEMFQSNLEQSINNHVSNTIERHFRDEIEESFNKINQSICEASNRNNSNEDHNKSSLFETKDSFLLDIRESSILEEKNKENDVFIKPKPVTNGFFNNQGFYGLPSITKGLFKSYRNIEKFYDWQEECLNLDAIKERRNLIYALPTSGGKTLVAEVLMLREVLNRKKNALFILPFVAIVQEKIWALSPFAVQLEFLVEEYAAGKGHIPPKKRRTKHSIYIATIEKGLALIRSLIELNRLDEIGLIVVDELHLIGEKGRGGTLETLLSTVIFTNQNIQIVGMSATIGNLNEIAQFLRADVFQREFRPVDLTEYVKLGNVLHKIVWGKDGMEIVPERELSYEYSAAATALDPDRLGGLVSETAPRASCLVFCPTKRNCENVTALLCKLQRREMTLHRTEERKALEAALRAEGASGDLVRSVRYGVAFHHAGLAGDERNLLEQAFRSGVISVLCCTSTLAAGVNLPARRVIVRAPLVGRDPISLGAYRQMAGRAGRAGVCDAGESIIICSANQWPQLRAVLQGGLPPARSQLAQGSAADSLVMSAVALKLATSRVALRSLLACTLLHVAPGDGSPPADIKSVCDASLRSLLQAGALEAGGGPAADVVVYNDTTFCVSKLGWAAIKGCMDLQTAKQLQQDLEVAARGLVLIDSLHLLYLVTPRDAAGVRPDYRHYYSLYCNLDDEGVQTARILGITEVNAIRMMTGKPITNVPEKVLCRFYVALMLHDLWKQVPFPEVADKFSVSRGAAQAAMTSAAALASGAAKFCEAFDRRWPFRALFAELALRLQHCAAPDLAQLMELPAVKKSRALQLSRAGYKKVEDLAKASAEGLVSSVPHLSRGVANHLISAARLMLIEKVENLRAEAEDVMEELNA